MASWLLLHCDSAVEKGLWESAINVCQSAIELFPNNPNFYIRKARAIYASNGNAQETIQLLEQARTLSPENSSAYFFLAQVYADELNFSEADSSLQKAIEYSPDNQFYSIYRANLARDSQNYPLAESLYIEYLNKFPNEYVGHYNFAKFLFETGKFQEAVDEMEKAVNLSPSPPAFYYYDLGTYYEATGDIPQAINAYETALQINPRHADANANLDRLLSN